MNVNGYDIKPFATLRGADLRGAVLRDAVLRGAVLYGAVLRDADLRGAVLYGAVLRDADLANAKMPHFQIPQEGSLIVWGKKDGRLVKTEVPEDAKRTANPLGRKCRAEFVKTLWIEGADEVTTSRGATYRVGELTFPNKYDGDIRVECTHGIHFFLTREEAEEWM